MATKKKAHRSGPTKSYQSRIDAGLTPVFVWLPANAVAVLEALCERNGLNKRDAIIQLLMAVSGGAPDRPRKSQARVPVERPRGEVMAAEGSPQTIAERIRAKGARRRASVL